MTVQGLRGVLLLQPWVKSATLAHKHRRIRGSLGVFDGLPRVQRRRLSSRRYGVWTHPISTKAMYAGAQCLAQFHNLGRDHICLFGLKSGTLQITA